MPEQETPQVEPQVEETPQIEETPKPKRRRKRNHEPQAVKTLEAEPIKSTTPVRSNRHLKKDKIGTPTLGRSPNYVTRVGLGNLKVIHADGYTEH